MWDKTALNRPFGAVGAAAAMKTETRLVWAHSRDRLRAGHSSPDSGASGRFGQQLFQTNALTVSPPSGSDIVAACGLRHRSTDGTERVESREKCRPAAILGRSVDAHRWTAVSSLWRTRAGDLSCTPDARYPATSRAHRGGDAGPTVRRFIHIATYGAGNRHRTNLPPEEFRPAPLPRPLAHA